MMSKINRVCSLCKIKFQTSFVINKDSSNPLSIFCTTCFVIPIQNQTPTKQNDMGKESTLDENTTIVKQKLFSKETNNNKFFNFRICIF